MTGEVAGEIPVLAGSAAAAAAHRGSHMQIIACAGSGKTETVSQRVASLVTEGVKPSRIVAFTFTEKAASELKERIRLRVQAMAGAEQADLLGTMYVGTIHGFCFQMLSRYESHFEAFDVLDSNRVAAFLQRVNFNLDLKRFDPDGKLFRGMRAFQSSVEVVENELLDLDTLPEPFKGALLAYYDLLDNHKLMTFGQQIGNMVRLLEDASVRARVAADIDHLIVDEYQDVNPAQERLIQLLAKPLGNADLVVVGDDDQAIYQWRGSKVDNIVDFAQRYQDVATFELLTNRRSRPAIVNVAEKFAATIEGRLAKAMIPDRESFGPALDICYDFDDEAQEAEQIAMRIQRFRRMGFPYKSMAVLVRTKSAYPALMKAFEAHGVPVQPGGRTGLFDQPDADFFGRVFAWFIDHEWRTGRFNPTFTKVSDDDLKSLSQRLYGLTDSQADSLLDALNVHKGSVGGDSRNISFLAICYEIADLLEIKEWPEEDALLNARLGTIARFFSLVADYESIQMRAVRNPETGEQYSASDQKDWYFRNFAILISNYAIGEYDDFEGEEGLHSDSVEMTTVHSAKGLEWPIVFLPSLTDKRFPTSRVGQQQLWHVPREMFDAARYEGSDADERRLFYVALTRACDWIFLSAHRKVTKQSRTPSPYMLEVETFHNEALDLPTHDGRNASDTEEVLRITYSEIADYLACGYSFWLRNRLGFPPRLVREMGYGNAVHHLMRSIAEFWQKHQRSVTQADIDRILAEEFYLPYAGKALAEQLGSAARKLATSYVDQHADELGNTWATERPFELALDKVVIAGRADVIFHDDDLTNLSIVDYKTGISAEDPDLQLQIYTEAGRREGLSVAAAYVHDLKNEVRHTVDVSKAAIESAAAKVQEAADNIKARNFEARPDTAKCQRCDVRFLCRSAAT